jgi:hypothetical protein
MPLGTPYVTPAMLASAPTGVPWDQIPEYEALDAAQLAEQTNICWRATSIVDTYCNQVLRATVDSEELSGPGAKRVGIQRGTGNGLLIMRRWPVTDVLALQTSPNRAFPRTWTVVLPGQYAVEHPLINLYSDSASATMPDGGTSIVVAPGYICPRRNSTRLLVSYTNGWPHTSLTADAAAGDTVLNVDDVTGWTGASGFAYDGSSTESLMVESVSATTPMSLPNGVGTAQTGPGTVTLTAPLAYAHLAGVVVSALPANVLWATVMAASMQALVAGITSISIPDVPGSQKSSSGGATDLQVQYKQLLDPFKRII